MNTIQKIALGVVSIMLFAGVFGVYLMNQESNSKDPLTLLLSTGESEMKADFFGLDFNGRAIEIRENAPPLTPYTGNISGAWQSCIDTSPASTNAGMVRATIDRAELEVMTAEVNAGTLTNQQIVEQMGESFLVAYKASNLHWEYDSSTDGYTFFTSPKQESLWKCYFSNESIFWSRFFDVPSISYDISNGVSPAPDATNAYTPDANGLIVIEAETFQGGEVNVSGKTWAVTNTSLTGVSGNAIKTTPNTGTNNSNVSSSPRLDYTVNFAESGTYHVWIKGVDYSAGRDDNSVHVGLNNTAVDALTYLNNGTWEWSNESQNGGNVTISVPSAGTHTFSIWMREDGAEIDQIHLTKNGSYNPEGNTTLIPDPDPDPNPDPNPNLNGSTVFGVIGDYGDIDNGNSDKVAAMMKTWDPSFILTTGDNNYDVGSGSTIDKNIGQLFHEYIYNYSGSYGSGSSTRRFFPTIGNHDAATQSAKPYTDFFDLPGNERYYDFIQGDIHFFAINSDSHEVDGKDENSIQALWFKEKIKASTAKFKVAYFHHAAYSSGDHGNNGDMQWPFEEWGIDLVLQGHDHVYERIHKDDNNDGKEIIYITTGNGGKSIYPFRTIRSGSKKRYNDDYGAVKILINNNSLIIESYSISDGLVDSHTMTFDGETSNPTLTVNPTATPIPDPNPNGRTANPIGEPPAGLPSTYTGPHYYVSPSGNDDNNGSESSPWKTISYAVDQVTGGTIHVKAGVYKEIVRMEKSGTANNYITLLGEPGAIIDGEVQERYNQSGLLSVHDSSYINIDGMTVRNAKTHGIKVTGDGHHIRVRNNITEHTNGSGIYIYGKWKFERYYLSDIIIEHNEVHWPQEGRFNGHNIWQEDITLLGGVENFEIAYNYVNAYDKVTYHGGPIGIDAKAGVRNGTIHHNYVENIPSNGIYVDAGESAPDGQVGAEALNIDIYQNTVKNVTGFGVSVAAEGGGKIEDVRVFNNIIEKSGYPGVSSGDFLTGSYNSLDAPVRPRKNIDIFNNVIVDTSYSAGGWGGGIRTQKNHHGKIYNNIIVNNTSKGIFATGSQTQITNNCFFNTNNGSTGENAIIGDPQFVNAAQGDYRLKSTSACIDAGISAGAPSVDFLGNARPQGAGVDIGAYEQ